MSFIESDEHIMLFDWPTGALSDDDLRRIRETGVRTAYVFLWWHQIEPRQGHLDWTVPDHAIGRVRQAGYKVLCLCHGNAVHWGPDDWYLRDQAGNIWRAFHGGYRDGFGHSAISPWSNEGRQYELDFMRAARDRYAAEDVLMVPGGVHGGETILPGMAECWHDPGAVASFHAWTEGDEMAPASIRVAADLVDPAKASTVGWLTASLLDYVTENHRAMMATQRHREVWLMLPQRNTEYAELVETGPRSGNWLANTLYDVLPAWLNARLNIMLFEAFRQGGDQGIFEAVQELMGVTWVGSQYCEGLRANTERAIKLGLRGFITSPLHPDAPHISLRPDMLKAFEWSLAQWREAR